MHVAYFIIYGLKCGTNHFSCLLDLDLLSVEELHKTNYAK